MNFLNSNKRNFKFLQTKTNNLKITSNLKTILESTYTNSKMVDHFSFDETPERKLILKLYFELNKSNFLKLKIGGKIVEEKEINHDRNRGLLIKL